MLIPILGAQHCHQLAQCVDDLSMFRGRDRIGISQSIQPVLVDEGTESFGKL